MDGDDSKVATQGNMHRVKLYKLNSQGLWDDKGTGHVAVQWLPKAEAIGLVVVAEEDCRILMVHKILQSDMYQRQGEDTIITWMDDDIGTDVALSFQESVGCMHIWSAIQDVQRGVVPEEFMPPPEPAPPDAGLADDGLPPGGGQKGGGDGAASPVVELPWPETSNLGEIAKILCELSFYQKDHMASQLQRDSRYLPRLLQLFRTSEDIEDKESLGHLYTIIRSIFMMNCVQLMDEMMQDQYFWDVVGALEYDPDLAKKAEHRHFLRNVAKFKEVVTIPSDALKQKIHTTYRLGYIKDAVLPRVLDDVTFAALHSMMMFNYIEILTALQQDPAFFRDLFVRLKNGDTSSEYWSMLVAFIQELSQLATHPQYSTRQELYSKLLNEGLLDVLTTCMECGTPQLKLKATDIILALVQHDPSPIRAHLLKPPHRLFSCLVAEFTGGDESGVPEQILELLKMLLDPDTMEQALEKNDFLELFYETYISRLVDVLVASAPSRPQRGPDAAPQPAGDPAGAAGAPAPPDAAAAAAAGPAGAVDGAAAAAAAPAGSERAMPAGPMGGPTGKGAPAPPFVLGLIMELLCFCVTHHTFRIKYFILRHNIVQKVLQLLNCKQKWLVVAAIRFLRTCIGLKDDFYNRYLTRNDLLEPALNAFLENGDKYNLLNSAFLELIEFIRRENIRSLVCHFVDRYWPLVKDVTYVETFKGLRELRDKYEHAKDPNMPMPNGADAQQAAAQVTHLRRDSRDLDREEEAYFGGPDEDDDLVKDTLAPALRCAIPGEASHAAGSEVLSSLTPDFFSRDAPAAVASWKASDEPARTGMNGVFSGLVGYEDDDDGDGEEDEDHTNTSKEQLADAASHKRVRESLAELSAQLKSPKTGPDSSPHCSS